VTGSATTGFTLGVLPRWFVAGAFLAAEVIWLSYAFDAPGKFTAAPQLGWLLDVVPDASAIVLGATFVLLVGAAGTDRLGSLINQPGYRWWPWAALHALAFLVFSGLTAIGFGVDTGVSHLPLNFLSAWAMAGASTFGLWLLVIAPAKAWLSALKPWGPNLLVAIGAGAAIWLGGMFLQNLWQPLARGTLQLSALLLLPVYPEMIYDPERGMVGSSAFAVEIAPACSGYEGIALVTVFTAAYLYFFREHLAFPKALILFPIGIASIWLTNALRIAALVVIGTSVSPEVAARGFHSQAGWIAFTVVTVALIAISHRWLLAPNSAAQQDMGSQGRAELALLIPLVTLIATSLVTAAMSAGFDVLYPAAVLTTGAVLWHYRAAYLPMFGPLTWEPFAIGILVFCIWALLVSGSTGEGQALAARLSDWPTWLAAGWLLFRVLGSVIAVPLAEELAFRGYLIRKLVATDFEQVRPGHFTWLSFILTSLLFGLLHQHLLAGALAGAAYALALYRRGRIGDAILAHGTTNALIAAAVLAAGQWGLWA